MMTVDDMFNINSDDSSKSKYFKSENGIYHFFIGQDCYITQALELMEQDSYLNKLLKGEGYKHVVFCDFTGDAPKAYSFDKKSLEKFASQGEFSSEVAAWSENITFENNRYYLKRANAPEEIAVFYSKLRKFLRDEPDKNVVIMPFENMCGEVGYNNRMKKCTSKQSILLFTVDNLNCFDDLYKDKKNLLRGYNTSTRFNSGGLSIYRSKNMVVECGEVDVDEIAALLYHKKLFECKLKNIPVYAVNTLAKMIKSDFGGETSHFKSLAGYSDKSLSTLCSLLNAEKSEFSNELQNKSKTIKKAEKILYNNDNYVRRIHSDFVPAVCKRMKLVEDNGCKFLSKDGLQDLNVIQDLGDKLYKEKKACVPYIKVDGEVKGTGFIVSPDGYMFTCTHVIKGGKEIRVSWPKGYIQNSNQEFTCSVIRSLEDGDITLLKIDADDKSVAFDWLSLSDVDDIEKIADGKDNVTVFGYPVGLCESLSSKDTNIQTTRVSLNEKGAVAFTLSALVGEGYSGGPVILQRDSRVIGIFQGSIEGKIDYAIPVKYLWDWFTR